MKLFKNTFNGGWNTDSSKPYQSNDSYRDLVMASITSDDDGFLSVTNLRSSIESGILFNQADTVEHKVLSAVDVEFIVSSSGSKTRGIIVFLAYKDTSRSVGDQDAFGILFYPFTNLTTSSEPRFIYQEFNSKYNAHRVNNFFFDTKKYSEADVDVVYFTDGVNPPRYIYCDATAYSSSDIIYGSNLTENELELRRLSPVNIILDAELSSGEGSLISGTYQFGYQFYNSKRKVYSKYSQVTNPVYVSNAQIDGAWLSGSGSIGGSTSRAIDITIPFGNDDDFEDLYDSFRVFAIKNIDSTTVPQTTAYIIADDVITDNYFVGQGIKITYKGAEVEEEIPIEDIVIDDAPIKSFSTIEINKNTLIGGNTAYNLLDYDNGNPVISSGTVIQESVDAVNFLFDYDRTKEHVGHFRNEVYRYGIVYYDKYSNFSEPIPLDFSSSTQNAGDSSDFKFGDRNTYKIFDSDADIPNNLGLRISGIKNHPSWAKGFVIVRLRRRRNIIDQTPVIPTEMVEPAFASVDPDITIPYPGDGQSLGDTNGTLVPKNMRHSVTRHILRKEGTTDQEGTPQEVYYFCDFKNKSPRQDVIEKNSQNISVVYPATYMYTNGVTNYRDYSHSAADKLVTVDVCSLTYKEIVENEFIGTYINTTEEDGYQGNYVESESVAFFGALDKGSYFYSQVDFPITNDIQARVEGSKITVQPSPIEEIRYVSNYGDSVTLTKAKDSPYTFGDYTGIESTVEEGYKPSNLKSAVILTRDNIGDIGHLAIGISTFETAGDDGIVKRTDELYTSDGRIRTEDTKPLNNGYAPERDGAPVSFLRICNIEKGLGDDRYGDKDAYGEYISTGTYYKLSDSEVENNTPITVDVWGGDCHISRHTFKVNSSTYAIAGIQHQSAIDFNNNFRNADQGVNDYDVAEGTAKERWGSLFGLNYQGDNNVGVVLQYKRPIAVKSNTSYVTLWLESEIDGQYKTPDIVRRQGNPYDKITPATADVHMLYEYNFSYTMENRIKTFIKHRTVDVDTRGRYRSRVSYSKKKVYQTNIQGFDTFPVDNIYDMDESFGSINCLILTGGDNLYCFQEQAISFLPTEANIIQTEDLSSLSIRSSDFLGNYKYISTLTGTKYPNSIASNGDQIYFFSDRRSSVFRLSGSNIENLGITSGIQSNIRNISSKISSYYDVRGVFDPISNHYWLSYDNGALEKDIFRFDEKAGKFLFRMGNISPSFFTGFNYDNKFVLIGKEYISDTKVKLWYNEASTTEYGVFMGTARDGYISMVVNPNVSTTKTFDIVTLGANGILKDVTLSTENSGNIVQKVDVGTLIESNYRIRRTRDAQKRRLRGDLMNIEIYWNHTDTNKDGYRKKAQLDSVLTRYRESFTPY